MNSNETEVTLNPRIEMDEPIGKGTTTLEMLYVQHPWLQEHISSLMKTQVLGFYENVVPEYRQNLEGPNGDQHELEDIVTAEECNGLVKAILRKDDEIKRLRQKNHNQRQELRRLNASHLAKNARVVNAEVAAIQGQQNLTALKAIFTELTGVEVVSLRTWPVDPGAPKQGKARPGDLLDLLAPAGNKPTPADL